MGEALGKGGLDAYTEAHLVDLQGLIQKAIDAPLSMK